MPDLIDEETPADARTRTGYDGQDYELVFSDEFNKDGRTFWPGKLTFLFLFVFVIWCRQVGRFQPEARDRRANARRSRSAAYARWT